MYVESLAEAYEVALSVSPMDNDTYDFAHESQGRVVSDRGSYLLHGATMSHIRGNRSSPRRIHYFNYESIPMYVHPLVPLTTNF